MSGLPTNSGRAKDQGCNPVSSNCVVWQGPDLQCIGLCKGDTISDVLAKMATELCTLVDMFDLGEYDLTCLAIPTSQTPKDVGDLLQILVERICALEGVSPIDPTDPTASDCPNNCIVPIADCFYYIDPQGDTVTTMTLLDYVNAIGNKICDILNEITILQNQIATLQEQVNGDGSGDPIDNPGGLTGEVGDIKQNKADINSLYYQVNSNTDASAGTVYVTDALRYVENFSLQQSYAVGSPTLLYQNILKAGNISQEDKVYGSGLMSSINGWTTDVQTSAESIGNLWLTVADLRDQVEYMKENCCSTGCSSIWLNFRAELTGPTNVTVYTDGSTGFTPEWSECTGNTQITITDTLGNSATFTTSLIAILDEPGGYTVSLAATSIDPTLNLTVVADSCFINTSGGSEVQCNEKYTDTIINIANCPTNLILGSSPIGVSYQFNSEPAYTYILKIYYQGGGVSVQTHVITTPTAIVSGLITGLLPNTTYDFETTVVDTLGNETVCPRTSFTTLGTDCQPPINASAILTTP
jgi:hypothetical protein